MGTIGLIASVVLPWLVGTALCARMSRRAEPGAWAWRLGYGYVLGLLLATLVLRGMSAAGMPFHFLGAAAILLSVGALGIVPWSAMLRRRPRGDATAPLAAPPPDHASHTGAAPPRTASGAAPASGAEKLLIGALLGLLVLHAATILLELLARPLYPWDAWAQWATKAKVWTAMGRMVPFVSPGEWLKQPGLHAFTDAAAHYPGTVPLFQVWTAIGLGRWDEALVNLPWFGLWTALVLAAYSHARAWSLGAVGAVAVAFAVGSLPFVNVHAMLAGYADLPQAVVFALAAMATLAWTRTRALHHAVTAVLCAFACPFIKQPGIVWVATLAPALLVTWQRRVGLRIVAIGAAAAAVLLVVLARTEVVILGYRLQLEFRPVGAPLASNLFLYGNWNLLFWLFPPALIFGWRRVVSVEWLPLTLTIAAGMAFLFVVFFFTSASAWVEDMTTVNRAVLHLAPLIAFFIATLFATTLADREAVAPEQAARAGRARTAAGHPLASAARGS